MKEPKACSRCGTRYPEGRFTVCPRCLSDAELSPAMLGDSLELIEEIGRGGMSTVWKARHLRLDRTVAVKFLSEDLAAQPEFTLRFEREAHALARLNHPAIVAIHDFGREGDRPYIVMEYVAGRDLAACLPLPPERACEVALHVLDALAYAHAQGIVHRDIKPQNILVDDSGRVKVTDFGLARLVAQGPSGWTVTTAGRLLGTPAYMAPEALSGAPPDPRMDVFSVGVLLYEMVTGRRPIGDFPSLEGPMGSVVRRALAPEPERRYASAGEMRGELAAARQEEPGRLSGEERYWLRAVALVQTLATAVALWAFVLSVTPRVLGPGDLQPLIMLGTERLPDGRVVSRARFETWPTLAALAAVVFALSAQALLRRHWREARLERFQPDDPLPEARAVLACGAVSVGTYVFRRLLETFGIMTASAYIPIIGGLIELAALFFVWTAVLEAWRRHRPLHREARLWLGFSLALVPPAVELTLYLVSWRP